MLYVIQPTYVNTKAILKGWKPGLFVNFDIFPCSFIRIRFPNTDSDPREQNQCRFMRIRIQKCCKHHSYIDIAVSVPELDPLQRVLLQHGGDEIPHL
jgi:hypothetical protein